MDDSALIELLLPIITAGLTARGKSAAVKLGKQPRQIGTPSAPVILVWHLKTTPYGALDREDVYDPIGQVMNHTEVQWQHTRFQISGLAPQSPSTPAAPSASDYVRAAAQAVQSDAARAALKTQNVGVLRISDVTSVWFEDEKGQNAESPSFDLILSHKDVFTISGAGITNYSLNVDRI